MSADLGESPALICMRSCCVKAHLARLLRDEGLAQHVVGKQIGRHTNGEIVGSIWLDPVASRLASFSHLQINVKLDTSQILQGYGAFLL